MNTKRQNELNEAVDATLDPAAYRKLQENLETDAAASDELKRLQSAEGMLRDARPQPAPRNLALNIMAKIQQAEALPEQQAMKSTRALALGLGITAIVGLPLLFILSLLTIATLGTGSTASGIALAIVGVASLLYAQLNGLTAFAGQMLAQYPLLLAALLLIPIAIFGLWRMRPASPASGEHEQ